MKIKQYQIDAFADRVFEGNPAAVCPLSDWLDDGLMQAIAAENNLSETAFFAPAGTGYRLRWFTPTTEVDLCGHATLAAAHVLYDILGYSQSSVAFETRSGVLTVARDGALLTMDFPAEALTGCETPAALVDALGPRPVEVLAGVDYVAVFESEATVRALSPDFAGLARLDRRGVVATAPGAEVDFVSRFFAPKHGIPEDPVTGSAHCALTPLWSARLGKANLHARQVSPRGGTLLCRLAGERVMIAGRAVTFMEGEIDVGI